MKTKREKLLEIALLKEKVERLTGKKVIFKEDRKPSSFEEIKMVLEKKDISYLDELEHVTLTELYENTDNPSPLHSFDSPITGDEFVLLDEKTGQEYFVVQSGFDYCRYIYKLK
jgi:hypothetical protein